VPCHSPPQAPSPSVSSKKKPPNNAMQLAGRRIEPAPLGVAVGRRAVLASWAASGRGMVGSRAAGS